MNKKEAAGVEPMTSQSRGNPANRVAQVFNHFNPTISELPRAFNLP